MIRFTSLAEHDKQTIINGIGNNSITIKKERLSEEGHFNLILGNGDNVFLNQILRLLEWANIGQEDFKAVSPTGSVYIRTEAEKLLWIFNKEDWPTGSVAKYLECVIRVIRARPLWREGGQVLGIMSKSM